MINRSPFRFFKTNRGFIRLVVMLYERGTEVKHVSQGEVYRDEFLSQRTALADWRDLYAA